MRVDVDLIEGSLSQGKSLFRTMSRIRVYNAARRAARLMSALSSHCPAHSSGGQQGREPRIWVCPSPCKETVDAACVHDHGQHSLVTPAESQFEYAVEMATSTIRFVVAPLSTAASVRS